MYVCMDLCTKSMKFLLVLSKKPHKIRRSKITSNICIYYAYIDKYVHNCPIYNTVYVSVCSTKSNGNEEIHPILEFFILSRLLWRLYAEVATTTPKIYYNNYKNSTLLLLYILRSGLFLP